MSDSLIVKDKVIRYTREIYETVLIDSDGDVKVPFGDYNIYVSVLELAFTSVETEAYYRKNQLSRTLVRVQCDVLHRIPAHPDLFKWTAIEGQCVNYGHFYLEVDGDSDNLFNLFYEVQLPGETLDPGELKDALNAAECSVRDVVHVLQARFGGRLSRELS